VGFDDFVSVAIVGAPFSGYDAGWVLGKNLDVVE
jgi:predicted NAD/FAD-binding protein